MSRTWIAIFIGSTIGGLVPALWGGEMLSYAGVVWSGIGAGAGLWVANMMCRSSLDPGEKPVKKARIR